MQEKADDAIAAIEKELGADKAKRVHFLSCDLADWKDVVQVSERITQATDRLDVLILNAARGIMTYQLSPADVDLHMSLNHFGHVVLTSHLLPLLKQTADSSNSKSTDTNVRIVTLGSNVHQSTPSNTRFASLTELNTDLGPNALYGRSKLAQMLYARYLARHLTPSHPRLLANTVHPGFVSTRQSTQHIHEAYPLLGYGMSVGIEPFKKDQFQGAVSAMYAATVTQGSGQYICPPATVEQGSEMFRDDELMERLMTLTRDVLEEKIGKKNVGGFY